MKITKKTKFREIINNEKIVEFLFKKGMYCIGCPMSSQETIEQGAIAHGINPDDLIEELNKIK